MISKRSFNEDTGESTFTDPYGNIFHYGTTEKGSAIYYPNNTFTERTFDEYGRLESITHKRKETDGEKDRYGTETTLESFSYQYDNNGNITKITYANGEYTDYTYDSLDRLITEEKKTVSEETVYKIEYKFDNNDAKNGNIHQVIVNDLDTTTFTYDEMNQLTGITHPDSLTETLTYDDNGNLTQTTRDSKITSYEWDCNDRLNKVSLPPQNGGANGETVEFKYDSDGMLVKQTDVTVPGAGGAESEGTEHKFIQTDRYATRELIKNKNGEWEPTATHIVHGTMLSSYLNSNSVKPGNTGDAVFYHTDHLGSVRLITDENGNVIDTITTDAYGNPLPHADSSGNKRAKMLSEFNFVGTHGIRYVEKVRLHNMRARWYGDLKNRFISEDTLESVNKYEYPLNPLLIMDPTGMFKLFHLYTLEDSKFKIYPGEYRFKNFQPLLLNYKNLKAAIEHSYNDHTVIYMSFHSRTVKDETLNEQYQWMRAIGVEMNKKKKIDKIITYDNLLSLLKKRDEYQMKTRLKDRWECRKFLWLVLNGCSSAKAGLIYVPGYEKEGKKQKELFEFIDIDNNKNSNSVVYSGWSNVTLKFNEKLMPSLIYNVLVNNINIVDADPLYTISGYTSTMINHLGAKKYGKKVKGEWFNIDRHWW